VTSIHHKDIEDKKRTKELVALVSDSVKV